MESSAGMAGLIARLVQKLIHLEKQDFVMQDGLEEERAMQTELLNPTQKTKVTIILRAFEEHLRQALRWLDGYRDDGFLYFRKLDLPPENQEEARKNIEEALNLISHLVEELDLPPQIENAARIVLGCYGDRLDGSDRYSCARPARGRRCASRSCILYRPPGRPAGKPGHGHLGGI